LGLALVLQPDQCDVIVLDETTRAGAAISGADDGLSCRICCSVRQASHEIGEVVRLVDLNRLIGDWPCLALTMNSVES